MFDIDPTHHGDKMLLGHRLIEALPAPTPESITDWLLSKHSQVDACALVGAWLEEEFTFLLECEVEQLVKTRDWAVFPCPTQQRYVEEFEGMTTTCKERVAFVRTLELTAQLSCLLMLYRNRFLLTLQRRLHKASHSQPLTIARD
jgi:hypothetical protein